MSKTTIGIIVAALVLAVGAGAWYIITGSNHNNQGTAGYASNPPVSTQNSTDQSAGSQQVSKNVPKGNLYLSLTDAALNMPNVTAVTMTVDSVKIYNQVNGSVATVQIPQSPITFSLLDLNAKSESELISKVSLPVGTYQEFELHIAKVTVTSYGRTVEAVLPSNYFVVTDNVMVNAGSNTFVQFDVMADKSLHVADDGQYVFAPVIQFNSRVDATVQVGANNMVVASFGQTNAPVNEGMDVDGTVKTNFMLSTNVQLNVNGGVITIDNPTSL